MRSRCDGVPAQDDEAGVSRRSMLRGLGGVVGAGALAGSLVAAPVQAAKPNLPKRGLGIILLGTQGGPPVDINRYGIASTLVVDQAVYLVDAGRGAVT